MSTHCAITGCSNGGYRLLKWQQSKCEIHDGHNKGSCACEPPFKLNPFPGKVKNPKDRMLWKQLVNRQTKDGKLWSPGSKSRICSEHFQEDFSYPIVNLGYPSDEKVSRLFPERFSKRRKLEYSVPMIPTSADENMDEHNPDGTCDESVSYKCLEEQFNALKLENEQLRAAVSMTNNSLASLLLQNSKQCQQLKALQKVYRNSVLNKCQCKKPLHEVLLKNDKDVTFYTGMENSNVFEKIHDLCFPFFKKKWRGKNKTISTMVKRKYKKTPKKMGRKPTLVSKDEMLLTLMKLRLGLTEKDLSDRFGIAQSTVSSTFLTWIRLLSKVLSSLVYVPDLGNMNKTRPVRFKHLPDVYNIIDCFEIFIETPKNLDAQKITWSEYKHHNTIKVLISCTPSSHIIFISKTYPGSISDKNIVMQSNFLDTVPTYTYIMADKGFNIEKECTAQNIGLYVPPGKRGTYQMLPTQIQKTKRIANLRILIEQVIRQVRSFKILANELTLTLLPCIDDIVTVCSALVNLKCPIFKD